MYFLANAWTSAQLNFLSVFYQQTAHFSKMQIGFLQTLPCICAMVAPLLWGAVADHFRDQRRVHVLCVVTGALLMFAVQFFSWSFGWTVLVVVACNFQVAPDASLLDHAVLDLLDKVGGEYGKQRLFGALGYGVGAYVTGLVVTVAGISWSFNVSLALGLTSLLVLRTIPPMQHHSHLLDESVADSGVLKSPSFMESARLIGEKVDVLVLLAVVFLMGLMYGVLSSFLTLNLYNLSGGNAQIVGIAIMCEALSELPAFFYSHEIIQRFGIVNVLLLSIVGYFVRVSYYAVMANAWSAIPFEFLHGVTYGLAWAACTQCVYAATPPGSRGRATAIVTGTQDGFAHGTGTLVGVYFYEHFGHVAGHLGVPVLLIELAGRAQRQVVSTSTNRAKDTHLFLRVHTSMADQEAERSASPHDSTEDAELVSFASSLLAEADSDSQLPETPLDAAALDAVHAAIHKTAQAAPAAPSDSTQAPLTIAEESPAPDQSNQSTACEIAALGAPPQPTQRETRIFVWFRRDLRLHDNLALHAALQLAKSEQEAGRRVVFAPLYIVHRPKIMLCGVNRFQFMLESVSDLADALAARGSRLVVARGDGVQVLRRLLPAWGITHLFFDAASEPFAIDRDKRAVALAKRLGVQTYVTHGYTLYDLDAVIAGNENQPPKTYTAFLRALAMLPQPPKPLPTPEKVCKPTYLPSELYQQVVNYWKDRLKPDKVERRDLKEEKTEDEEEEVKEEEDDDLDEKQRQLDEIAGPEQQFTLPEVTDFGYEAPSRHPFIYGGEQIALSILRDYCRNEGRVVKFEKPKTSPAQTTPSASTTSLSPYLYFGCISPRTFLYHVRGIQEHHAKATSATPVSLDGQLLWREFFHCHGRANPYFDKMEESPTCLQIDWRCHTIPEKEEDMTDDDKLARSQFKAWTDGQTGFPWIDAIMIQLKEEGWMHHLARHSVACFLTRGDLYISWVRGLEIFQERLIDHDWSINAGNWLWLSSSYFFSAYFRVYSPSTFGKKWDPEGLFIRKYVPALRKMPVKYIYEPWKAPVTVQRAAGCLIGKDYPFPIVDHKIAMRRCMDGMKKSYAIGEYGRPPLSELPTSPRNKRPRENSSHSSETSDDSSTQ